MSGSSVRRPMAATPSPASPTGAPTPTGRAMPTFDLFDVVSVPFRCTDRSVRQRRPALVVSAPAYEQATGLVWVVMITAAENRSWPGDVRLAEARRAGLSIPSVVRPTKIATIEAIEAVQGSRLRSIAPAERRALPEGSCGILGRGRRP